MMFVVGARSVQAETAGCATIKGAVFVDVNHNGTNDDQRGLKGVTVTAYGDGDVVVASGFSGHKGAFSLSVPGAMAVRVEFGALPTGYADGPHGLDNATSVVFPTAPRCSASLGVVRLPLDGPGSTRGDPGSTPGGPTGCKVHDDDGCEREQAQADRHDAEQAGKKPGSTTTTTSAPKPTAEQFQSSAAVALLVNAPLAPQAPAVLPIEIGNRVWADTNGNGIQDPSESAISGVTVSLWHGGSHIDSTVTDALGEYYFDDVAANTTYEIRLDNPADLGVGKVIDAGVWLPTAAFASRPTIDSNAVNVGGVPTITSAITGAPGVSDHSFDFGLVPKARLQLALTTPVSTAPQTGSHLTFDLVLTNIGPGAAVHPVTVSGSPPVGLVFESVSTGWTCAATLISFTCMVNGDLASGGHAALSLKFLVGAKGSQAVGLSLVARSASDGAGITGNTYLYAGTAYEVSPVIFTRPGTTTTGGASVSTAASTGPTNGTGSPAGSTAKPGPKTSDSSPAVTKVLSAATARGTGLAMTGANALWAALMGAMSVGFGACLALVRRRNSQAS